MVKSEMKTTNAVLLRLHGYRVVALKPDFDQHTIELEEAIQEGISACADMARADFYDIALQDGWAYIHVYRAGHAVYLVAHSPSTLHSFATDGFAPQKFRPRLSAV